MVTAAENQYLCRIGPGTPMGTMMRRFWHPFLLSEQLPERDGQPVRVTLLGEKLVAFRDTNGRIGLLEEYCMHRRASLALGRVENCGIRCVYHGWKFGVDGEIQDIMNNPDAAYRQRKRQKAYPVVEAGGLAWTYMGPAEQQPEVPNFPFFDLPDAQLFPIRINVNSNYLQLLEGGLDSSHVGILHSNIARSAWRGDDAPTLLQTNDTAPRLEIENTEFGYHYAAIRKDSRPGASDNVRIVPFIMPYTRIIPGAKNTTSHTFVFEVPADDYRTITFLMNYDTAVPMDGEAIFKVLGLTDELYDRRTYELNMTWANNLGQKREDMDANWSGLTGIEVEDAACALSMPVISDRENENLVAADMAIVRMRRRLLESAQAVERGGEPIGLHVDGSQLAAIDTDLPRGEHWRSLVPGHSPDLAKAS